MHFTFSLIRKLYKVFFKLRFKEIRHKKDTKTSILYESFLKNIIKTKMCILKVFFGSLCKTFCITTVINFSKEIKPSSRRPSRGDWRH